MVSPHTQFGRPSDKKAPRTRVLVNVSSLAPSPFKSVSQSVRHKTRHPIPKKGRSQNSQPHPEKRVGHKTRHPIPKKGSVTKLETPSVSPRMRGQTASGFDTQARVHPTPRLRLLAFALGYTDTASDSMSPSLPTMADSRYAVRIVCSTLSSCSIDRMTKSSHNLMLLLSEHPIAMSVVVH